MWAYLLLDLRVLLSGLGLGLGLDLELAHHSLFQFGRSRLVPHQGRLVLANLHKDLEEVLDDAVVVLV